VVSQFFSLTCKSFQVFHSLLIYLLKLSQLCKSKFAPTHCGFTNFFTHFKNTSFLSWEKQFYLGNHSILGTVLENIQVGLNWLNSRNLAQLDAISQSSHWSWIIFAICLFSFWKRWLKSRQTCYLYMDFTSQNKVQWVDWSPFHIYQFPILLSGGLGNQVHWPV